MEDLLENIEEFLDSGDENIKKGRFNAAVSDYFKVIVISCDFLIYRDMKILPKNHNERFYLLRIYFKDIYTKVNQLFETYTRSYNLRLNEAEAIRLKEYAHELKKSIADKK
jgi:uncharacterized protein (UPF0332 family)